MKIRSIHDFNAYAELEMFYRMSVEDAVKKLGHLLKEPEDVQRKRKGRGVVPVIQGKSSELQDELPFVRSRVGWGENPYRGPKVSWTHAIGGSGEGG